MIWPFGKKVTIVVVVVVGLFALFALTMAIRATLGVL